jgi:diguanylate cyclase (GGDEF)-like protein
MLYSESKERENRFIISLKIAFPFLVLALLLFYIFKISSNDIESFVLFILLVPIYIYYIFYLIYSGFKSTLIDPITKTFTRKEILEKIENTKNKKYESTVILIKVDNIVDINERYGITNADNILRIFCDRLNKFLKNYNFRDIAIGRYGGGHFLLVLKGRKKELTHLITIFEKELKHVGINDIEIKIDFSLIDSDYDKNIKNIVKKLFSLIDKNEEKSDIKPNEFENIVCSAVDNEKFIFKYQPLQYKNKNREILEVLTKIYSKSEGVLSRAQIQKVVNHLGREMQFDKKVVSVLLKELENIDFENRLISIKLSPVSLRNTEFRQYLTEIFYKSPLKTENFILEFSERRAYKEIHRFKEILNQYKKSGFKIALDNFGGDNCSLEYIKTLPIDIVKFDIEFTKNISDERYQKITESYLELLHSLHVEAVIKFVDKEEIYKKIEKFGFDYIQGFLISKPKNLKEIIK